MAPKDKDPKLTKSGIIYRYQCPNINSTEQYIGESGRSLGDRYKEHLRAPSPIHMHTSTTGHPVSPDCFTIVDRESQGLTRNIKEAMYIKVNDPSLNGNLEKNFYFCQFGTKYSRTHCHYNSSNIPTVCQLPPAHGPPPLPYHKGKGAPIFSR